MAAASLILGLISLILSLIPGISILALITGSTGAILGFLSGRNGRSATAYVGIAFSLSGIIVSLLMWIACLGIINCGRQELKESSFKFETFNSAEMLNREKLEQEFRRLENENSSSAER